tara:strand:- start:47607 stop:47888 length:282 start_codon:yes stop_codon:yes gene_type:complete
MSKTDIKIGDRIVCVTPMGGYNIVGMEGFIRRVPRKHIGHYSIEFDESRSRFHNCDGDTIRGHGYYVFKSCFKVIKPLKFKVVRKSINKQTNK